MGRKGQLRRVEDRLIRDVKRTTIPFSKLGKKYGVSRQAISDFAYRRGINRSKREHTEKCSICKGLIRIAIKPHSDFLSSHTIIRQLRIGRGKFPYHARILRKKGLISQKFGRLRSVKAERVYQAYFKKGLPIRVKGWQMGIKNLYRFRKLIKWHKASGWDVPDSFLQ